MDIDALKQAYVEISDEQWQEIEHIIPGTAGKWGGISVQNREFITAILYLAKHKLRRTRSLEWNLLDENQNSYNRRFTNWRKKGIWEQILHILIQYKDFAWLADPFVYGVFLSNHKLVTKLNQIYLLADMFNDNYDINDKWNDEAYWRYSKEHAHIMKNRRRRRGYKTANRRGPYKGTYSTDEQDFIIPDW